jgi:hypothetical protein
MTGTIVQGPTRARAKTIAPSRTSMGRETNSSPARSSRPKSDASSVIRGWRQVAADGEHGSAPFIEIALVGRWIVPLVLILVCIMLLVYFKA